jgi:hypothetical protein
VSKTDGSWKKHGMLKRVIGAQTSAYRVTHPTARIVIIDMNAGDGEGVALTQGDLFRSNLSVPTPALAMRFAGCDDRVILCERDPARRRNLGAIFPSATILADHAHALNYLGDATFAFVISDACGLVDIGFTYLEELAAHIQSDFIVAFNEGVLNRINHPYHKTANARYGWMADYREHRRRLNRRYLSVFPDLRQAPIRGSANFNWRMLIIANGLCTLAKQPPFQVIQ